MDSQIAKLDKEKRQHCKNAFLLLEKNSGWLLSAKQRAIAGVLGTSGYPESILGQPNTSGESILYNSEDKEMEAEGG